MPAIILSILLVLFCAPTAAFAAGEPVLLQETSTLYATLEEAAAAANAAGGGTLVILSSMEVASDVIITSNVRLLGGNGAHTVSLAPTGKILVQSGSLALGDGTETNPLTISHQNTGTNSSRTVHATGGSVAVYNGVSSLPGCVCSPN